MNRLYMFEKMGEAYLSHLQEFILSMMRVLWEKHFFRHKMLCAFCHTPALLGYDDEILLQNLSKDDWMRLLVEEKNKKKDKQ